MRGKVFLSKRTASQEAVETFAPHSSDHLEKDPQQFLAFLLKSLHEELNHVEAKPYGDMMIETKGREKTVRATMTTMCEILHVES